MEQQISKGHFFVAVITDEFLAKSEQYFQIITKVDQVNTLATLQDDTKAIKPMYVIVKRGVKWGDFQNFPWRQIHFYSDDKEFDAAFDKIKQDVKQWKKIHI